MERAFQTPLGAMCLEEENGAIVSLRFCSGAADESPLLLQAQTQILEFFSGTRREFSLPLAPRGTPFQRRVWNALAQIPYGETRSYAQVAAVIGNPKACRAVGNAANRNPLLLLIPCHRVTGASGALTGYAGGLERKQALLALERSNAI